VKYRDVVRLVACGDVSVGPTVKGAASRSLQVLSVEPCAQLHWPSVQQGIVDGLADAIRPVQIKPALGVQDAWTLAVLVVDTITDTATPNKTQPLAIHDPRRLGTDMLTGVVSGVIGC
jgi:hypothetical protein